MRNTQPLEVNKLIHNMNADLGSIQQAVSLMNQYAGKSNQLSPEILPLLLQKTNVVLEEWGKIKEILKNPI